MESSFVLNPLDIIIAAIIIFGMMRGAKQGIITKSSRLVTIGIAVILGFRLRGIAESLYQDYLNLNISGEMVAVLGFCTAFVISYMVISTILGYVATGLEKVKLPFDNALGALLGGLVATLVMSIGLIMLSYVNFPSAENAKGSILYPHVKSFARYTVGIGAEALREANRQINKYGFGSPPPSTGNQPASGQQPADSPSKPKAIR